MTKRIELPGDGGFYIDVKEVHELRSGDRRAAQSAITFTIDPETGSRTLHGDWQTRAKRALAARIITGWNLNFAIPKGDPAVIDKLTMAQEDALYKGIAEHVDAMDDEPDPTAEDTDPTGDSAT